MRLHRPLVNLPLNTDNDDKPESFFDRFVEQYVDVPILCSILVFLARAEIMQRRLLVLMQKMSAVVTLLSLMFV